MTRARRLTGWAGLMLLTLAAGCQGLGELASDFDPRQRPEQKAFEQAIAPYLVEASVYQGPATELKATALPLTPGVRRALAQREATAKGWDQAALERRLAEMEQDAGQALEVVISLYAPEKGRADLAAQRPDWTVSLTGPEGKILAQADLRAIRERSALHEALYPFWGPWDRLFRLRFRPPPAGEKAVLVLSGAPGRAELRLKLD